MSHSVISPCSYHGYQDTTEDRIIPTKIGCSQKAERADRLLFKKRLSDLQSNSTPSSTVALGNSRHHFYNKGDDSIYSLSYKAPTIEKLNQSLSMKEAITKLPHHNRFRRQNVHRSSSVSNIASFSTIYSSTYNSMNVNEEQRPQTSVLTDFNRRKWKISDEFKPSTLRKTREEDIKLKSQLNKSIVAASAVGSVRDQRSDGRINLREEISEKTTYRIDIEKRYDERLHSSSEKLHEESSMLATTKDLNNNTSKNTKYNISYMGHIPENERNRSAMYDNRIDERRRHSRDCLRYTTEHNIPGYSGFKPHSVHNDIGPVQKSEQTVHNSTYKDHGKVLMDREKHFAKRKWLLSNFFAAPIGESAANSTDGIVSAEKYYHLYRPYEALPKLGMKSEQSWISVNDLKRTLIL